MDGRLIEVLLYVIIAVVIGIASLTKAARRARQQDPEEGRRAQPKEYRTPVDDVREFLEEVAKRAGREMGYKQAPPKPAPPPPVRVRVPERPARPARPVRMSPRPKPAAPTPESKPIILLEETVVAKPKRPPMRKVEPIKARLKQAPTSWVDRLPKRLLARGILFHEILGPPRALKPKSDIF